MNKTSKKVPEIRFPGFTEDWEQRKFEEFIVNVAKKNKENLDLEPYAVTNDRGFIAQKEAHDDFGYMSDVDRSAYNIVPPNSFAYNPARINVGSLGYYSGTEKVIVSSLYEVFQTKDYIDDRFLWHWFKSDIFPKWIERLQEGSVRLYFYFDKLIQCQMLLPSVEEQKKIGAYFDELDNLITLHQHKCEQLGILKKSMLQKMFPKKGETVPEIRFPGFTDDWEQRKLSECVDYFNGSGHEDFVKSEGRYELITLKSINSEGKLVSSGKYVDEEFETLQQGTIIMMLSEQAKGMLGMTTIIPCNNKYILNQRVAELRLKDGFNSLFMTKAINEKQSYFEQMGAGTKVHNITKGHVEKCLLYVPQIEEQTQLGKFFLNLDNLITLHQRKCEELKELKKCMLQKMFV